MRHTIGTLAVFLIGLFSASTALPCSRVLWVAGDNQVFVGRTQDWTEQAGHAAMQALLAQGGFVHLREAFRGGEGMELSLTSQWLTIARGELTAHAQGVLP